MGTAPGFCARSALTTWNTSTTPSVLQRSITVAMAQNMPLRVTVSLHAMIKVSITPTFTHTPPPLPSSPAVYKYGLVSSPPLHLGHFFYHIHHTPKVGTLSIWCPAGDVELGDLVSLLSLLVHPCGLLCQDLASHCEYTLS